MQSCVTRFSVFAIVAVTIVAALPVAWAGGQQKHSKSTGKTKRPQESWPQAREVVHAAPELTFVPDTAAVRALYAANQIGDPVAVDKAFADGADPNATVTPHWPAPPDQKASHEEPAEPLFRMIGYANGEDNSHKRAVRIFRAYLDHGLNLQSKGSDGETPLFHAFMLEDDGLIREVVARGADVNALSASYFDGGNVVNLIAGWTIRSHEERTLPLLLFFLDKHVNPNVYDASGKTPLHSASLLGLPRMVSALLAHGADPQAKTRTASQPGMGTPLPAGRTAIQLAARMENTEVIRLLAKVMPNLSPGDAALAGEVNVLRHALDSGAAQPNSVDEDGNPLLTLATRSGNAATVTLLLTRGAKVDARDKFGRTPLHEAAVLDQVEVVRLLLAHHANPNAIKPQAADRPYDLPDTPLSAAISAPSPAIVALLLKYGAIINSKNTGDALDLAVQNAGGFTTRRLGRDPGRVLRGDALLDAQDSVFEMVLAKSNVGRDGGPALARAARRGQWGIAQVLLKRGANVNTFVPIEGNVLVLTVESIGLRRRKDDKEGMAFLRELLRHRPNVNAVGSIKNFEEEGSTALAVARFWKMPEVEKLLKKAGARR